MNNTENTKNTENLAATADVKVAKKPGKKVLIIAIAAVLAVAIIAGLVFLPINNSKNGKALNYSLEFTGGISTTVTFDGAMQLVNDNAKIIYNKKKCSFLHFLLLV